MPRHDRAEPVIAAFERLGDRALEQCNLILGIASRALPSGADLWFWTDSDPAALAAVQTPPWPLVIAGLDERAPAAIDPLIADLTAAGRPLPAVNGPPELARVFAERWCACRGCSFEIAIDLIHFRQGELLTPERPAPGCLDRFAESEKPLFAAWRQAFQDECMPREKPPPQTPERIDAVWPSAWCWRVDGTPVSMALAVRPVRDSIAIGGVYTPPDKRRRGYAGTLVAALSARLAADGYRMRLLDTDADNPTSNAIYQRIGYRPIGRAQILRFVPKGEDHG